MGKPAEPRDPRFGGLNQRIAIASMRTRRIACRLSVVDRKRLAQFETYRFWPETDIVNWAADVRFQGQSRSTQVGPKSRLMIHSRTSVSQFTRPRQSSLLISFCSAKSPAPVGKLLPRAEALMSFSTLKTTRAGIRVHCLPPAGFNPRAASPLELRRYGQAHVFTARN